MESFFILTHMMSQFNWDEMKTAFWAVSPLLLFAGLGALGLVAPAVGLAAKFAMSGVALPVALGAISFATGLTAIGGTGASLGFIGAVKETMRRSLAVGAGAITPADIDGKYFLPNSVKPYVKQPTAYDVQHIDPFDGDVWRKIGAHELDNFKKHWGIK